MKWNRCNGTDKHIWLGAGIGLIVAIALLTIDDWMTQYFDSFKRRK